MSASSCLPSAFALASLLLLPACQRETASPGAGGSKLAAGSQTSGAGQDVPAGQDAGEKGSPQDPGHPLQAYGFARFHADFPFALHVPRRQPGEWFSRNREQIFEKVLFNLSGQCSKAAWNLSKEFFDRHPEAAVDLLIPATDRALQSPALADHAENMLDAMGRHKEPRFAPVLARAAQHSKPGVRRAAVRGLINAGTEAAVLKVFERFHLLEMTVKRDWIQAGVRHLSVPKLKEVFTPMVTQAAFGPLRDYTFGQIIEADPERAVAFFAPIWDSLPEDLSLYVAGVYHAAGRKDGHIRIKRALEPPVKEVKRKLVALRGVLRGDPRPFRDAILRLTNEGHQGLNVMLLQALAQIPGDVVTNAIRAMNDPSGEHQQRQSVLRILYLRGITQELDDLVEVVRKKPAGMEFNTAVADLIAARYPKVVPALAARLDSVSAAERAQYVKWMSFIDAPESMEVLKRLFLAEEAPFGEAGTKDTNVTFIGKMMSNLKKQSADAAAFFDDLPKDDYRRRGTLLFCLANMAAAWDGNERGKAIYDKFRDRLRDRSELPQIRLLCLEYLRRDIRVDDVLRLRRGLEQESKAMQAYLNDYLNEFF